MAAKHSRNTAPDHAYAPSPGAGATGVGVGADLDWTGGDPDGDLCYLRCNL